MTAGLVAVLVVFTVGDDRVAVVGVIDVFVRFRVVAMALVF